MLLPDPRNLPRYSSPPLPATIYFHSWYTIHICTRDFNMTLWYPLNRLADACFPAAGIVACTLFGAYTFLDILCIQRAPRLAFNFNYWQGQQFARTWKAFGSMAGKKLRPMVGPLASTADKVVVDIGSVVHSPFEVPVTPCRERLISCHAQTWQR